MRTFAILACLLMTLSLMPVAAAGRTCTTLVVELSCAEISTSGGSTRFDVTGRHYGLIGPVTGQLLVAEKESTCNGIGGCFTNIPGLAAGCYDAVAITISNGITSVHNERVCNP